MSSDPEVWYVSGTWAWLTALFAFLFLTYISAFFMSFMLGAAVGVIIWITWPQIGFWIERRYNDRIRHR